MKPVVWFRMAAGLMVLFAVGHTLGFLTFRPKTAEGQAVWAQMNGVSFSDPQGHGGFTYAGFYVGFGLFISVAMIFAAWMLWMLGSLARRGASEARTIAWGIVVWQIAGALLGLRYFGPGPAVLSVLTAVFAGLGAASSKSAAHPAA